MSGVTRVKSRSNKTSDQIERASDVITDVIPRDTMTDAERYIIFTKGELTIPDSGQQNIENLGFEVRKMEDYAIEYEHKENGDRATYIAL